MTRLVPITMKTPWHRIEVTEADWRREDPLGLVRMLEQLFVIRRFEEKILELHGLGLVHGPAHSSIGQEGGAVGAMSVLGSADKINGTHRAHHQFLAKFLNHAMPADHDPRASGFAPGMQEAVRRSMAEIMGLTPGFCGGRGGAEEIRGGGGGGVGPEALGRGEPNRKAKPLNPDTIPFFSFPLLS